MSKLPKENQFLDLSDYGRPFARAIANSIKNTNLSALHVTTAFIVSAIIAIYCILNGYPILAAFFIIMKSVLDAADGELARIKKTPSYVGRYYDSIADIIINLLLLLTIRYITDGSYFLALLAFIGIQLQGTLYNYYYVILRNLHDGDTTSRVFENEIPTAFPGEDQKLVTLTYKIYNTLYIIFDKAIYYIDRQAIRSKIFPKWFMTLLSTFGLGFQLLIMSVLLVIGKAHWVIPFFIYFSFFILIFVAIRRLLVFRSSS